MNEETRALLALVCELSRGILVESSGPQWYLDHDAPDHIVGDRQVLRGLVPELILRIECFGASLREGDHDALGGRLEELRGRGLVVSSDDTIAILRRHVNRYTAKGGNVWRIELWRDVARVYRGDDTDPWCSLPKVMAWHAPTPAGWELVRESQPATGDSQKSEKVDLPPLSKKASLVRGLLLSLPEQRGMTGGEIIDEVYKQSNKKVLIDQSELTGRIMRELKPHGVLNKKGYYIPMSKRLSDDV